MRRGAGDIHEKCSELRGSLLAEPLQNLIDVVVAHHIDGS
jgi:hypothetical protein